MALNNFTTYLDVSDQGYDEAAKAERWYLEFAIPRADWNVTGKMVGQPSYSGVTEKSTVTVAEDIFTPSMVGLPLRFDTSGNQYIIDSYGSSKIVTVIGDAHLEASGDTLTVAAGWGIVPLKGDPIPTGTAAFPPHAGVSGFVLYRKVDFFTRAGWVVVKLTYGYDFTSIGINRAYVTGRTVLMQSPIPNKINGTLIIGEVTPATDKQVATYMDISPGKPREYEESLQLIRLHAYVDEAKLKTTAGALQHLGGALHSTTWSVLGYEHTAYTMKYNGCVFDVYEHGATPTYIARFDFLVKWTPWLYKTQTTEYDWVINEADVLQKTTGNVIGKKGMRARRVKTATSADIAFRPTHDFTSELNSLIS